MKSSIPFLLYALFDLSTRAHGERIRAQGRSTRPPLAYGIDRGSITKRAQASGSFGTTQVGNSQDVIYTSTVTLGGVDIVLQIDTGSSDLWTNSTIRDSRDLSIPANVTYGQGSASGSIRTTTVEFAGYSVEDQAFIGATRTEDMNLNGIIGLGPPQGSVVLGQTYEKFNDTRGDPFLNRVFAQNASTPNFITFTLGRTETPTEPFESEFTIGEIIPDLNAVTNFPKMPVQVVDPQDMQGQHWSLSVDAIFGPDGQEIKVTSGVPKAKKLVAVLDTGFSFPPVPPAVSDAFYGRIQGAQFSEDDGLWIVPCDQLINVGFVIGGVNYYIHPLDAIIVGGEYDDGTPVCVGTFQPNPLSFGSELFDMVLGDAFLRNVYTYINFGNFEDENVQTTQPPFIQLLNLTNPNEAHQEFVKSRMNGVDRTKDSKYALLPAGKGKTSKGDKQQNLASLTSVHSVHRVSTGSGLSTTTKIIIAAVAGSVLLIALISIFVILHQQKKRRRRFGFKPMGTVPLQPYQSLTAAAPQAHPAAYEPTNQPGGYGYYGSGPGNYYGGK